MAYDYSKLNDREFEELGASIIRESLKKNIETFKAGKDGGVDGRFWLGDNEGIIQCKHYSNTSYATLLMKLKKEEAEKVKKLKPKQYIFITSKPLSRYNKEQIKLIFEPYIKRADDIWGKEDLDNFLNKKENQKVVEENYKLWITSTVVLDVLFNNAISGRSSNELKEIQRKASRYVITENHHKGIRILEAKNVIIVTGDPGIGKTTLSENLALHYAAQGYLFCKIEQNISEAESIYREDEEKKIIFYFDDFLGSNFLEGVGGNRDSHVMTFINRIHNDKTKKFILNSRTNIFQGAIQKSHEFQNKGIDKEEFLLTVQNLSTIDKAKILYSHLIHSKLDILYIDEIYKSKRYNEIIRHNSFNPRLIQFILEKEKVTGISVSIYWDYLMDKLNNPADIWSDFFSNLDEYIKGITFLVTFNGKKILEADLKEAFQNYKELHKESSTSSSFTSLIKGAMKSVIHRYETKNHPSSQLFLEYGLFNPSLADFILREYSTETVVLKNVFKSLQTKDSLSYLASLNTNKIISSKMYKEVCLDLFACLFSEKLEDNDWGYLSLLCSNFLYDSRVQRYILEFIKVVQTTDEIWWEEFDEVLYVFNNTLIQTDLIVSDYDFIFYAITDGDLGYEDLKQLLIFIDKYDITDDSLLAEISRQMMGYLFQVIPEYAADIDISDYVSEDYYYDDFEDYGGSDYSVDESGIKEQIISVIDEELKDFEIGIDRINIIEKDIIDNTDIDSLVKDYLGRFEGYDGGGEYYRGGAHNTGASNHDIDNIDSIFER